MTRVLSQSADLVILDKSVSLRRASSALFWMSSRRGTQTARRYHFAELFNTMKNIALIC
jgi:hypothetical protein